MNLIIVESPTKAKTIGRFVGRDYKLEFSFGHIRDLPEKSLGVDTEKDFRPRYVVPAKAKKTVARLKAAAAKTDKVILATDEDREGEAISWHLAQALGLKNPQRIVFHEITKRAITEALEHPRPIDMNLVDSQQARRVLDRLVGYKLSPFLWQKVARGLSAGRVQSVTLRLIVDRENEIRDFKTEEYWTIVASLLKLKVKSEELKVIEANLIKIDDRVLEKFDIKTKEEAEKIAADLEKTQYSVLKIEKKETRRNPPPPFTTSTLQQEAVKRLGYPAKRTMMLAQKLYEQGLITYMRTDSVNLSQESVSACKEWLTEELGSEYASQAPRFFTAKSKLVQEAHEAIRPTDVSKQLTEPLYKLIWSRFVASQMPQAKIATTVVEILARGQKIYGLKTTGQQIVFDGYLKIWPQQISENELPPLTEKEELQLKGVRSEQHFTEPPPRYTEASLIKVLEEYGIGRPSTYAPTISVIQEREYVSKDGGKFYPTDMGETVNRVMIEHFPQIVDINFTAKMEDGLDDIAHGKEKWQELLRGFYTPFSQNLDQKYQEVSRQSLVTESTDEKCEKCGKPMAIKLGPYGKFLACTGYPECKNTKPLKTNNYQPKILGMKCPKCSNGEIVERRVSRGRARGKVFWGCSRYPGCDYATWEKPV